MASHVIDYKIYGDDLQFVEVELDPGETIVGEAGSMMYMEEGVSFEAKMGDGSNPDAGVFDAFVNIGKRILTKESIFLTHFTATKEGKSHVGFAAPYPGKIIPMDLEKLKGEVTCQKSSFLCAAYGTKVSIALAKRFGAGLFGGEGFILQKLEGDGKAFVHASGTVHLKKLEGNTLYVDTGCLVAFTKGVEYSIERAGGLKTMIFGGEGLFLAKLSGHGYVWLQSLPFSRLADRVISASHVGKNKVGEGSDLGAIGKIIDLFN
ncbi:MAG: TIGR00266 family protein [Bacteriovoracaceae bacterium]|jgi:uncharacterized protein (TIGR00266 family)|nr:TIGR00266 family protein [Bacteriovoracaceae bacterium]